MSNFNEFVSTIKNNGVAKASHFFCDVIPPKFMMQTATTAPAIIPFYIESVNLPEITLFTVPVKDYGVTREVVVDKSYGTCTMTLTADQNMTVKMFFDDWARSSIIQKGGVFAYPQSYLAETLSIYKVDQSKNVTYVVLLNNVYPKIVDDTNLAANDKGLMTFRVQFVYESWDSFQFSTTDPNASITNDNSANIRRAWNFIQLIRTGANKDAIKSMIENVGTKKVYDIIGKKGIDTKISTTIDGILGKTGVGGVLESIGDLF